MYRQIKIRQLLHDIKMTLRFVKLSPRNIDATYIIINVAVLLSVQMIYKSIVLYLITPKQVDLVLDQMCAIQAAPFDSEHIAITKSATVTEIHGWRQKAQNRA